MIKITRLDGSTMIINAENIQYLLSAPDTIITLNDRDSIVVKESIHDILKKFHEYKRSIYGKSAVLLKE